MAPYRKHDSCETIKKDVGTSSTLVPTNTEQIIS